MAAMGRAQETWLTAMNNPGGFGQWAFLENRDPWDAQNEIRKLL